MGADRGDGEPPRPSRRRRADARDNRAAVIAAAAGLLRAGRPLTMRAVAGAAGVSRSTLYRHFANPAELMRALEQEALAAAAAAIGRARERGKPPLAELRAVVSSLIEIGVAYGYDSSPDDRALADAGRGLEPLAGRLAAAAGLGAPPSGAFLESGIAHFVDACLCAGAHDRGAAHAAVERMLRTITDPLDRGLLLLDAQGRVVACNPDGRAAVAAGDALDPVMPAGGVYEDGTPAASEDHPLRAALGSGEPQEGIRGHLLPDGELRWHSVAVRPLRRAAQAEPYGFVAVFTDISEEKRYERLRLRAPGELRARTAPLFDVVRALDEVPPPLLPEQVVAEATRVTGGSVALYMLDIDGSHLLRLAGHDDFPARIAAPLALGPELAPDGLPDLAAQVAAELPGAVTAPMWLRGRAVGVLLATRGSAAALGEIAQLGAAALELANGYTDVIDAARRRKDMNPAAEIQQSLIPPRIVRMGSGEIAGSVLPSYEVGGDWFDYVENRDGAWIAIADAAGRGPQAGGLGSVGLAALRAARRNDATLEQAVRTMHETMCDVGGPEFFLTAVVARWHPVYSSFSWINCGHPPPLLLRADDTVEELATPPDLPLGVAEGERAFRRRQRRLLEGDRVILYSDGIARRRTDRGVFGTAGIVDAVRRAGARTATASARAIQEAVVTASEDPLPDDAAVVVLAA